MSWFLAVLVRGSFVEEELDETRLADTLFQLVEAADAEGAYQRALELVDACREDFTDDDGSPLSLRGLGLADLRAIEAAAIGDGTEVYSELISGKPSERVASKDRLTVFETDEELDALDEEEAEPEPEREREPEPERDPRFSSDSPIR